MPPTRLPASSNQSRDRILAAAGPIFAKNGFAQTTIRQISQAAGVNLASVNYYFGDKRQLYAETLEMAQRQRSDQFPLPKFGDSEPAESKLRKFNRAILQRLLPQPQTPWQSQLLMREVLHTSEASRNLIEKYFQPDFRLLLGIIDELTQGRLPLARQQQVAISILGQCLIYRTSGNLLAKMIYHRDTPDFDLESLTEHITEFSLAGIQAASPVAGPPAVKL
jgi:AcrR family transcriptional regulator